MLQHIRQYDIVKRIFFIRDLHGLNVSLPDIQIICTDFRNVILDLNSAYLRVRPLIRNMRKRCTASASHFQHAYFALFRLGNHRNQFFSAVGIIGHIEAPFFPELLTCNRERLFPYIRVPAVSMAVMHNKTIVAEAHLPPRQIQPDAQIYILVLSRGKPFIQKSDLIQRLPFQQHRKSHQPGLFLQRIFHGDIHCRAVCYVFLHTGKLRLNSLPVDHAV